MSQKSIIVDTGFFLALLDMSDYYHKKANAAADAYSDLDWVTTWPVISELSHLLRKDHWLKFLALHDKGLFSIFTLEEKCIPKLIELYEKFKDKDIDLADLSLVLLAEKLNHGKILTCDRKDFTYLKWKDNRHFTNLLF